MLHQVGIASDSEQVTTSRILQAKRSNMSELITFDDQSRRQADEVKSPLRAQEPSAGSLIKTPTVQRAPSKLKGFAPEVSPEVFGLGDRGVQESDEVRTDE